MLSNLETLFYLDMTSSITEWEQLLADLTMSTVDEATAEPKHATWDAVRNFNDYDDVVCVSNIYAGALGMEINIMLEDRFPDIHVDLYANCLDTRLTVAHYDTGESEEIDTLEELLAFIDKVSGFNDYYTILENAQGCDYIEDGDGLEHSFMRKLHQESLDDIIEEFAENSHEVYRVLDTQDFFEKGYTFPNIVKAIASALAVKTLVLEQMESLGITKGDVSIDMTGSNVRVLGTTPKGCEVEIQATSDIGEFLSLCS